MSKDTFKFIIERPIKYGDGSSSQYVKIIAGYKNYIYPCPVGKYKGMTEMEHIRLAVAELKMELIKEISAAQWVYEDGKNE